MKTIVAKKTQERSGGVKKKLDQNSDGKTFPVSGRAPATVGKAMWRGSEGIKFSGPVGVP